MYHVPADWDNLTETDRIALEAEQQRDLEDTGSRDRAARIADLETYKAQLEAQIVYAS